MHILVRFTFTRQKFLHTIIIIGTYILAFVCFGTYILAFVDQYDIQIATFISYF